MPAASLRELVPAPGEHVPADALLDRFLEGVSARGVELYPAQEEAILELYAGKHVILNTPTGSGKSLVAEALHFKAFSEGKISVYTCPIKALVNEKFFALCEAFGPENVGMMTGDATVNRDAKILCCTAEILANLSLREQGASVDYVLMDEFHYYADRERGVAWQIPLLSLPHATFLLMSATLGTTTAIEEGLARLTGKEVAAVRRSERPVPLEFEYRETPLHETIADLVEHERHPIYLVNFTQRAAAEQAQALTSVNLTTREEKEAIRQTLFDVSFDTPYGKELERFLRAGIGLHHAGLLPKYRRVTERLARKGILKVVSGTDTLGVGVNIPIRTVLFTQLCKYNGQKTTLLSVRDFHQIAGRAGRKGFDTKGWVVVQAPEHVIENLKLEAKAQAGKKITRKQPPQKGYVHWDRQTLDRLLTQPPEPLEPRFEVTHGLLMNLLQVNDLWPQGGYGRLVELVKRSHGSPVLHQRHLKRAAAAFKALRQAQVIDVIRGSNGNPARVQVSPGLQRDFSLNYTLSLYLVEAVQTLDPESPTYALDVLTLCESILENPDVVLYRQVDKLKEQKINELKAQGVPYEERIVELEKVEHLKPNASFIYGTFAAFAERHPWVGGEDIRPKSVARDLVERYCTFNEYVREYGLQRSEGVLLRYLTDAYRAISQSVPETARTEALDDLIEHLRITVRQVDSSLLDEWEAMQNGSNLPARAEEASPLRIPSEQERLAKDPKALAARVRGELHQFLRALAGKRYEEAAALLAPLEGEASWGPGELEEAMAPYFAEHGSIVLTPQARLPHNTLLRPSGTLRFEATQKIIAPDGSEDWALEAIVDLSVERAAGTPVIALRRVLH